MRYYRMGDRFLAGDGTDVWDLSLADPPIPDFATLAETAAIVDEDLDTVARHRCSIETAVDLADPAGRANRPVRPAEIWAAGVTYRISEAARETESSMPAIYRDVYDADRPELFFKATPERTVGPREAIGIRGDSDWDVPEPELGIVLFRDRIVGYTIGNDVSSRDIEGENPLYLPQAKIYERSCAIGPCVASPGTITEPRNLSLSMTITREGETIYTETTDTGELVRSPSELVEYYTRHNTVPRLSVLLSGTGLVPPDTFTLTAGDEVAIEIEGIGTLRNVVTTV